jgi:gliding motility-associated-like protein
MKQLYYSFTKVTLLAVAMLFAGERRLYAQCSSTTPSFTLNLTGAPNASSVTPSSSRNGTCCGGSDPCTKIVVLLNPGAMALKLTPTGADPGGALSYEFNCNGTQIPGGTPICLSGQTNVTLTICKPGNNPNSYSVESIPKPSVPDSIFVRNGCTHTLATTGFSIPTIQWTAVNAGTNTAIFNSYLSCTVGCATVVVTPTNTVPAPYIDYRVSGTGQSPCETNQYADTVRVFFYNDLNAAVNNTTICYGTTTAVLTATATGGKPPLTYTWLPGGMTGQSAIVGPGTYTVRVGDQTGCPPTQTTAVVSIFTVPITANAGTDFTVCKSSPSFALSGTVTGVSTGSWSSSGSGTFAPSATALNATFTPAASVVSAGSVSVFLVTTNNQGCVPDSDTARIDFQNPPVIAPLSDPTVCANNPTTTIAANVTGFASTAIWSTPGSGTFSAPGSFTTNFTAGGAAITAGSVAVILTTTNNGVCPPDRDTAVVYITPAPVVNAGGDFTICVGDIAALNGSVTVATTTGSWSTSGNGSFANANALTTNYTPGPGDIGAGSVSLTLTSTGNGNCIPVQDVLVLSFLPMPTVTVTQPAPLCSNVTTIALSGTVTGATSTGSWSTSGAGNFVNPNALNAVYNVQNADRLAGNVSFTLTSTANGVCSSTSAAATVVFVPIATVTAMGPANICSSQGTIALTGTVTSAQNTGTWSASGNGPMSGVNNPTTYSLTSTDITNGFVTFTLTSTNNSVCPARTSTTGVSIVQMPTVAVTSTVQICSNTSTAALNGTVTGGSTGSIWSTGGSGFFSNPNSPNTNYTIGSGDNAVVGFTLTSTGNGPCSAASATAVLLISSLATVNIAPLQPVCSSQNSVNLNGTVNSSAGTATWATTGTGTFGSVSAPVTSYSFSAADVNNGGVTFSLTSTGNGVCPPTTSVMPLLITKIAAVNAGVNSPICSTSPVIVLNGTVSSPSGTGVWSSSSTNAGFSPNNSALNANYAVNSTDLQNGFVTFTLASTNDGPCGSVIDTVNITIIQYASVDAGLSQTLCSSDGSVQLGGSVQSTYGTGTWISNGSGVFSPSPSTLNAFYVFSTADINTGSVTFTLVSTNNGPCAANSATRSMQLVKQPTMSIAGPTAICAYSPQIALSGTVNGGGFTGVWISNSSGGFNPSNTSLNPTYSISAADVSAGSVLITFLSTNHSPCSQAADTLRVGIKTPPVANAGNYPAVCSSAGGIQLAGSVTGASGTGQWFTNGNGGFSPSATALNPIYQPSQSDIQNGGVTVTLTSTGNGACPASSSQATLVILTQPTVEAGPDKAHCSNQSVFNLIGLVGGATTSGLWSTNGSGKFLAGNTSLITGYSLTANDLSASSIRFTLTSTNNSVCPAAKDSMLLTIIQRPVLNLRADSTVCERQASVLMQANAQGLLSGVIWSSSGSGSFSPTSFENPLTYHFSLADVAAGGVYLTILSPSNSACGDLKATMRLNINPSPKAAFSVSSQTIQLPGDIVTTQNLSKGGDDYEWDFGDGKKVKIKAPSYHYAEVGFYEVSLVVTNEYDCTDTARKTILVIRDVQFPTAFTPNGIGDRDNEVFRPFTGGVTEYNLMIFNRWGELIFQTNDVNVGWDGTFNGKPCQQDAYVWKADVKFFDGRVFNKTGSITLMR